MNQTLIHSLRVDGELDGPKAVSVELLGVGIQMFSTAADVVAVGSPDGPATILLRLDDHLLVDATLFGVGEEPAILLEGEVPVQAPADNCKQEQYRARAT
jgi:hypothetical protein